MVNKNYICDVCKKPMSYGLKNILFGRILFFGRFDDVSVHTRRYRYEDICDNCETALVKFIRELEEK